MYLIVSYKSVQITFSLYDTQVLENLLMSFVELATQLCTTQKLSESSPVIRRRLI